MRIKIITTIICAFAALSATAQIETPDSVAITQSAEILRDFETSYAGSLSESGDTTAVGYLYNDAFIGTNSLLPYYSPYPGSFQPVPSFHPVSVYPGILYRTNHFALSGNLGVTPYPGMMNKVTGTLGMTLSNEKYRFYVGAIVNQYAFYRGFISQPGITGQFTYNISAPLSFTAFAYYYGKNAMPMMPNGSPMPPSMLGFYDVSRFGGYVNYKVSDHFGIMMGGQIVERHGLRNNRYELEPIATPYISVGSGKKKIGIGLPVGQILNGILGR